MHFSQVAQFFALLALAAPAAALPIANADSAPAALAARWLGPHKAVGPYIIRHRKAIGNRVKAHDATVRNNKLNSKDKRNLQEDEEADEE